MELSRMNMRTRVFSVILLVMISILVASLFLFPNDPYGGPALHSGAQNTAMNPQQAVHPDSIQINLMERTLKQMSLAGNTISKYFGGLRYFLNVLFLIPHILCFAWLSQYAYHYFHKKANKPLPIIAMPIGGHAPPFALA